MPIETAVWQEREHLLRVWRYFPFSRFLWLLQRKRLWLARADTLGDPWEIALAGAQRQYLLDRSPIAPLHEKRRESAEERISRIIPMWRQSTFINCWNWSEHESHALWRIYCGEREGVVIQSTIGKLLQSCDRLELHRVTYQEPGAKAQLPTQIDLATKKRPAFAYEQEVRIVHFASDDADARNLEGYWNGRALAWDPETVAVQLRVHPEADQSFMDTVLRAVSDYAPRLSGCVSWSSMRERPQE